MSETRGFIDHNLGPITLTGNELTGLERVAFSATPHVGYQSTDLLLIAVEKELQAYLEGKLNRFSAFPMNLMGTAFQQTVWQALLTIPFGECRSYLWMAQTIKRPKAMRAVGNANGKNPITIIIPCHRVIQNNGELGGYTGGLDKKRHLLALEQTHASQKRLIHSP